MRICVTAANCFIGFPFVEKASKDGHEVIAIIRRGNKAEGELSSLDKVTVLEMNMEEYAQLGERTGKVDCLVMLAWSGTRNNRDLKECKLEIFARLEQGALEKLVAEGE